MRPADTVTDRQRLGAAPRALAAVAALVVAGILIAGCGGGSKSPGVANVSTTKTSTSRSSSTSSTASGNKGGGTALSGGGPSSGSGAGAHNGFAIQTSNPQKALKFSECMRAKGVPNFPDPNGQGVIQGSGIDPNSSAFQTAQKACAKYMGKGAAPTPAQQAQAQAQALAFSKCMRSHGVTNFPDPQFGSGGAIRISLHAGPGSSGGLDPSSPIFGKAQKTCGSLLPGRVGGKVGP